MRVDGRGDEVGRPGARLDRRLVDGSFAVVQLVLAGRQLHGQAADQDVLGLHEKSVARPHPDVPEAGRAVRAREGPVGVEGVADVVEVLVVAVVDDRQVPGERETLGQPVRHVDLDQRVLRLDLPVVVRQQDPVLEVDLGCQHLRDAVSPRELPVLDDVPVREIDHQAPLVPDPLLGAGDQEAVRGAAGRHDRPRAKPADGHEKTYRSTKIRCPHRSALHSTPRQARPRVPRVDGSQTRPTKKTWMCVRRWRGEEGAREGPRRDRSAGVAPSRRRNRA